MCSVSIRIRETLSSNNSVILPDFRNIGIEPVCWYLDAWTCDVQPVLPSTGQHMDNSLTRNTVLAGRTEGCNPFLIFAAIK